MTNKKKKASFSFYQLSVNWQYQTNQQNAFASKLKNIQDIFRTEAITYPNYKKTGVGEFALYPNYKIDNNIICGTIGKLIEGEQKYDPITKKITDLQLNGEKLIFPSSFIFDLDNRVYE